MSRYPASYRFYTIATHGDCTLTMNARGTSYIFDGPMDNPGHPSHCSRRVSKTDTEALARFWRDFSGQTGYTATSGHDMEQMLSDAREKHEPTPVVLSRHDHHFLMQRIVGAFIADCEARKQKYSADAQGWDCGSDGERHAHEAWEEADIDLKDARSILASLEATAPKA